MARTLAPEERDLWRRAMGNVRRRPAHAALSPAPPQSGAPPPSERAGGPPSALPLPAAGFDRRSAQRLKRGQMPIEARLDLHGMTQAEAHRALLGFLRRAHDEGRRAVLVITGKGESGVLRAGVPRWLAEAPIRTMILAVEDAQPRHGGAGAKYVLLRKKRIRGETG